MEKIGIFLFLFLASKEWNWLWSESGSDWGEQEVTGETPPDLQSDKWLLDQSIDSKLSSAGTQLFSSFISEGVVWDLSSPLQPPGPQHRPRDVLRPGEDHQQQPAVQEGRGISFNRKIQLKIRGDECEIKYYGWESWKSTTSGSFFSWFWRF